MSSLFILIHFSHSLFTSLYFSFSLYPQVLSGEGRVDRMNGESAPLYLQRLTRRLTGLGVLDAQLQGDLERKVKAAKDSREKVTSCYFPAINFNN